jgi:hypothetical protein
MPANQNGVLIAEADYISRRSRRGAAMIVGSSLVMTWLALLLQPDHLEPRVWIWVLLGSAAYALLATRVFRTLMTRSLLRTCLVAVNAEELFIYFGARPVFRARLEEGLRLEFDRDASAWVVEPHTPRSTPYRIAVAAFPSLDRFLMEHVGKLTYGGSGPRQA